MFPNIYHLLHLLQTISHHWIYENTTCEQKSATYILSAQWAVQHRLHVSKTEPKNATMKWKQTK